MSSFDIKFPNVSAPTDRGKLEQIRSYLYQLAEQLNWILNSICENGVNQGEKESKIQNNSELFLQIQSIKAALANYSIDDELSEVSKRAVQNKVVTTELKKKQNSDSVITNWEIEEILRS